MYQRSKTCRQQAFWKTPPALTPLLNSKGLFAYNNSTDVIFSITTRNEAGTGSGYAARGFNDVSKLDTYTATKIAARQS